jgi:3-deoxy-D-manno-octulosonate 8-phosphate phosphatase (KDO 8-P phosphatase)
MPATGIKKRAKKIKLVLMDVDGVLTDGRLYFLPAPDGSLQEVKGFNAVDGIGIRLLGIFGIPSGVITGRNAGTTGARARMLGMKYA